jgi:hypothetical protein
MGSIIVGYYFCFCFSEFRVGKVYVESGNACYTRSGFFGVSIEKRKNVEIKTAIIFSFVFTFV